MRRCLLALAAACESLGHRTLDIGIRIVDAAAWVRDHVDPQRHGDAAVNERERADADREAFDRFMARQEVIVPPPMSAADAALVAHEHVLFDDREVRFAPVVTPNLGGPWRRKRHPFGFN